MAPPAKWVVKAMCVYVSGAVRPKWSLRCHTTSPVPGERVEHFSNFGSRGEGPPVSSGVGVRRSLHRLMECSLSNWRSIYKVHFRNALIRHTFAGLLCKKEREISGYAGIKSLWLC
ncbi:hypothetical protein CDAR_514701 [Caerostris darwini]|uniref:Secreted protein n=1 Tax=Caerostris darwini TaxID=1538125 RepID=A0AAV4QEM1_9ARAC|nr:hypothetical protein CDAR_514701 [Caerostris darwini]